MNIPLANIHPGAKIGKDVIIEPFATIYPDVIIGDGTWIGPNVVIMNGARIGKNCSSMLFKTPSGLTCTVGLLKSLARRSSSS